MTISVLQTGCRLASLGYTYPSNCGSASTTKLVTAPVMLPYLLVQTGVENAGFGAQMRLEHLHPVFFVKFLERIIRGQIFQIAKDARLRRTNLDAGRLQSARDAMITQGALFSGLGDRAQEPGAIRTGLDAKGAADAVFRVNQHRAIRRAKRRADRTGLNARRILTQVAQLRDEERVLDLILRQGRFGEPVHPAVGRIHQRLAPGLIRARLRLGDDVTLDPGAEVRALRHAV